MKRLCLLVIILSGVATAQTTTPTSTATTTTAGFVPSYYVGSGVSYDYYGKTGFAASTDFAARIGTTNYFSYTSLELTPQTATLQTGAAYLFFQSGYWNLVALGAAGLTTGTGVTLGSFTGGGFLAYDIGSRLTKGTSHLYVAIGGRLLNITSATVTPIMTISFGKGF